ncbi:MAG: hypothetical protein ACRD5Z_15375, partial [Bryobacteraceae bacterium]
MWKLVRENLSVPMLVIASIQGVIIDACGRLILAALGVYPPSEAIFLVLVFISAFVLIVARKLTTADPRADLRATFSSLTFVDLMRPDNTTLLVLSPVLEVSNLGAPSVVTAYGLKITFG